MKRVLMAAVAVSMGVGVAVAAPPAVALVPPGCAATADTTAPVIDSIKAHDAVVSSAGVARVVVTITAHDPDGPMACTDPATGQPVQLIGSSGIRDFLVLGISLDTDGDVTSDTTESRLISGTIDRGVWQATLTFDTIIVLGEWVVGARAHDNNNNEVITENPATFHLRYNVSLSANATPEPVRRGQYLKVTGSLRLLEADGYVPVSAGVVVRIYFSAKGSGTWTYMGAAKTTSKGTYTRSFRAVRDGAWQARYRGTAYTVPKRSAIDYLDVR